MSRDVSYLRQYRQSRVWDCPREVRPHASVEAKPAFLFDNECEGVNDSAVFIDSLV